MSVFILNHIRWLEPKTPIRVRSQSYQISRTFLYQLIFMANLQLETLFSDEKLLFQKDHRHLEQLLLLLRLEGKCSLLSIASIVQALEYHPHSVGYLSRFFQCAGQALPSTLSTPSQKFVFYLSDEIFARSEEHTSELQSPCNLVCRLLLEKKKNETTLE